MTQCLFDDAGVAVSTRAQDVAALFAQQRFGRSVVHGGSGLVYTNQPALSIKDKDAVRHRVKSRFPFLLAAFHYLKQARLANCDPGLLGNRSCYFDIGRAPVSQRFGRR